MASVAHAVDWPPVSLWQPPEHETWMGVPDRSVVALVFRLSGNDVVIRAPLHTAIDIASHAFKNGLADDFQIWVMAMAFQTPPEAATGDEEGIQTRPRI